MKPITVVGSSPRMRGTVTLTHDAALIKRFIPAHAGNSVSSGGNIQSRRVHPRACGEQRTARACSPSSDGSSPRMRGTADPVRSPRAASRFIPAHAGNRRMASSAPAMPPVHPRACGEQGSPRRTGVVDSGSSPRMRGTGQHAGREGVERRFIPAHAGNRNCAQSPAVMSPVHPRACGEQGFSMAMSGALAGSSPRMRGTAAPPCDWPPCTRFIPAHAGNRLSHHAKPRLPPVHPRACGEQQGQVSLAIFHGGSSPRMRGTGSGRFSSSDPNRFIPAHAGNRAQVAASSRHQPVHPRACGEQIQDIQGNAIFGGSSPRMRGTAFDE